MIRFLKFWYGQLVGRRGMQRPQYVCSTNLSKKWGNGHVVGCCWYAPDNRCICSEFKHL